MRRLTRTVALLVAGAVLLSFPGSGTPAAAAGPPLRYVGGVAGTLDPAFITNAGDVQLLLQLYAGLTRLDETGEPYPSLASGWTVSDDGLTYEFTIREDLTFSDGTPLTAIDVRRSWLRLLDPDTRATAPDVLGVVRGAPQRIAGEISEEEVGISAQDDATLVVELRHPASYFVQITATPTTFVVPPEPNPDDDGLRPGEFVGSGPYVADGTDGGDLVLRANQRYVAGPPPIEEIRWVGGLDTGAAAAFQAGTVDLVQVPGWDATWIAYDAELGPRLHAAEPLTVSFFGFDTSRPPFDDADVRRAFSLALDRERLVPLSEGASARAAPSIVPPALWPEGFAPDLETDADEARRLLDEAGHADRSTLGTIVVNGSGLGVGPAVAAWRDVLDVDIEVESMAFGDYLDRLETEPAQVFTISWIADYPSPHALYGLLLEPGAASNYGDWRDAEFSARLEDAARAGADELAAAYGTVERRVADEAPVIPWAYEATWWLAADGLRGLGNLTVGLLDLGRVSWDG